MFTLDSQDWAVFCANNLELEKPKIVRSKCTIFADLAVSDALLQSCRYAQFITGLEIPQFMHLDIKDLKNTGDSRKWIY